MTEGLTGRRGGNIRGSEDSSPLDTSMNSTFRLTHLPMSLPLSWPQSAKMRVRLCSPDLVTRGYLHASPPTQRATTPFSAAQGERACPQRTGWVRGPPLFGPPGVTGPVDWRGDSSAGCRAEVPWELWALAKAGLSMGAMKHKCVGTL